ncbi:cation transporter [Methylocaldum sp. RMAD-M]|uniref:cation transporter n=1 Tax=Methylocaldum sp. RMAD-M TaxID=2806557 RepID=UPI000A325100|nr:cation transporter [Methylocaldum sp. RMAD-M]MBP1150873.1 divalent metal cation (Fe/Co/Zn/Cd) transporter [Methylocaldum sp. RMAD-M]
MRPLDAFDLPPEKERDLKKARRLETWTLIYIASSTTFLGLTMGTSQAMRTSFFEDAFSSVPAIAFLVCTRIACRRANEDFPYGYHGVVSIGYLTASLSLVGLGGFLLVEAVTKLIAVERTTIGGMTLFGHTLWAGWPMLAAIAYTAIPSVFFGRAKLKLAPQIHDKILYADAKMMKADWMAETATAVGVLGVGLGLWWLDPVAAALVSADILKDGVVNVYVAVHDLMERRPMKTDRSGPEPLPDELRACIERLDWVAGATVRLREVGHVFFGEVFVTPRGSPEDLPAKIRHAVADAKSINWRLHDVTITVLDRPPE